jgi:hypothetical protein
MRIRDQQGQRAGGPGKYRATVHNQAPSDPVPSPQAFTPPPPPYAGAPQHDPQQQPYPPQPYAAQPLPEQPLPGQPYPAQPFPGQPYPGQPVWQPPPVQRANRFAIASLVCGFVGGLGVGSVLGIAFGITALVQIKRRPQRGRGIAIAGLVISVLTLVVGAGLLAAAFISDSRDRAAGIDRVSTDRLEVGQCIRTVGESTEIYSMPVVPCDQPHEAEVYHVFTVADGPFPGYPALEDESSVRCSEALEPYLTPGNEELDIAYVYPHEGNWPQDRRVTCIAADTAKTRTTSILD